MGFKLIAIFVYYPIAYETFDHFCSDLPVRNPCFFSKKSNSPTFSNRKTISPKLNPVLATTAAIPQATAFSRKDKHLIHCTLLLTPNSREINYANIICNRCNSNNLKKSPVLTGFLFYMLPTIVPSFYYTYFGDSTFPVSPFTKNALSIKEPDILTNNVKYKCNFRS